MTREHDPAHQWRSMSEEPAPSPGGKLHSAPSPQRKALARDIELLKSQRRKLYLILGALGGLALALPVVSLSRTGTTSPPPPPAETVKAPVAPPKPPKKPGPRTPAERMKELAEREQATPKAFRTLYQAWAELRREAPAGCLGEIRDNMERIQSAATKEFRIHWHPVHEKIRDLLGAHQPREAQKVLLEWKMPPEIDVAGDLAKDVLSQLESIRWLVEFEELRTKLLESYKKGDFSVVPTPKN